MHHVLYLLLSEEIHTHMAQTSHIEMHKHAHSISNRGTVTEVKRICYCMCLWKEWKKKLNNSKLQTYQVHSILHPIYSEQITPSADSRQITGNHHREVQCKR
jgi:hypothetical protein